MLEWRRLGIAYESLSFLQTFIERILTWTTIHRAWIKRPKEIIDLNRAHFRIHPWISQSHRNYPWIWINPMMDVYLKVSLWRYVLTYLNIIYLYIDADEMLFMLIQTYLKLLTKHNFRPKSTFVSKVNSECVKCIRIDWLKITQMCSHTSVQTTYTHTLTITNLDHGMYNDMAVNDMFNDTHTVTPTHSLLPIWEIVPIKWPTVGINTILVSHRF
jgi:hypothetical protein